MKKIVAGLAFLIAFYGCEDKDAKRVVGKSSGNINNIVVVADNQLWEASIGDSIRAVLAAPLRGLPNDEPIFKLSQMPPDVFTGFAKKNRTVLKIEMGKEADTKIYSDAYAQPQTMVVISGQDRSEIIQQLKDNSDKIIQAYNTSEMEERQRRISKSLFNDKPIQEDLNLAIKLPSAYRMAKEGDHFFWLRKDIKEGTMDILAYEAPLSAIRKGDSAVVDIVRLRDSIGKLYVEGPIEGSYLATEDKYTPFISEITLDGKPTYETKGIWDVTNAFMAGPFINYAIEDTKNDRYVIVEGYVFAPSVAKRDMVFDLETIIKSVKIN